MTRFLYMADSHWGAGESGYTMQPKTDVQLPAILVALRSWIEAHDPIDFVLHGGDMIHATSAASIEATSHHFDLPAPVYLCLGNHDLTSAGAVDDWLRIAPQFFGSAAPDFAITTVDCMVHVIPNQYGTTPFLWADTQDPHFLPQQLETLEARLAAHPDKTHLLQTHSPIHAIEQRQSGLCEPFHEPPESFTATVCRLAEKYRITCVLGAHSHVNMHKELDGVNYITVSSLVETPFEFKLFEVGPDTLSMQTHNLLDRVPFRADYNWNNTFVQGRACDRAFTKQLVSEP
jgi:3',5'-cyclic AMP phosphodiesterase CpdA